MLKREENSLHAIAVKCTNALKDRNIISAEQENIYIYGFELILSFLSSILFVVIWSTIFGKLNVALIFLLFFIPVRITSGGYHASTYRSCFILTNTITFGSVMLSVILGNLHNSIIESLAWIGYCFSMFYIYKNAPIVKSKYPMRPEIIQRNKRYTYKLIALETIALLVIKLIGYNELMYAGIIAAILVAFMIKISKKGEK